MLLFATNHRSPQNVSPTIDKLVHTATTTHDELWNDVCQLQRRERLHHQSELEQIHQEEKKKSGNIMNEQEQAQQRLNSEQTKSEKSERQDTRTVAYSLLQFPQLQVSVDVEKMHNNHHEHNSDISETIKENVKIEEKARPKQELNTTKQQGQHNFTGYFYEYEQVAHQPAQLQPLHYQQQYKPSNNTVLRPLIPPHAQPSYNIEQIPRFNDQKSQLYYQQPK